jgi:hypothetical protein
MEERLAEQTEGPLPVEIIYMVLGVVGEEAPLTGDVTVARAVQDVTRSPEYLCQPFHHL